ncbi:hypothetical protein BRADI_4g11543v3 [Brachypodium distachyon]|uniref:Uncharacterized protein n=1 Tax=Brachypodium distachyon TaxID=15368 RepID=A0A2K2CM52_BRADI|nr:hypothetical protein BRADI_4g11543v3 [Brachypodium distachyon]
MRTLCPLLATFTWLHHLAGLLPIINTECFFFLLLFFAGNNLSGRVFKFTVCSKAVGFLINKKGAFECNFFKCSFYIISQGTFTLAEEKF